jgi:hypothetical protein
MEWTLFGEPLSGSTAPSAFGTECTVIVRLVNNKFFAPQALFLFFYHPSLLANGQCSNAAKKSASLVNFTNYFH